MQLIFLVNNIAILNINMTLHQGRSIDFIESINLNEEAKLEKKFYS